LDVQAGQTLSIKLSSVYNNTLGLYINSYIIKNDLFAGNINIIYGDEEQFSSSSLS